MLWKWRSTVEINNWILAMWMNINNGKCIWKLSHRSHSVCFLVSHHFVWSPWAPHRGHCLHQYQRSPRRSVKCWRLPEADMFSIERNYLSATSLQPVVHCRKDWGYPQGGLKILIIFSYEQARRPTTCLYYSMVMLSTEHIAQDPSFSAAFELSTVTASTLETAGKT